MILKKIKFILHDGMIIKSLDRKHPFGGGGGILATNFLLFYCFSYELNDPKWYIKLRLPIGDYLLMSSE